MLDLLAVCQRIPPYYSVFVTYLKLISNVLSVYQRTCLFFHTSAYAGAIRRSVTGPLPDSVINISVNDLITAIINLKRRGMFCNELFSQTIQACTGSFASIVSCDYSEC